MRAAWTRRHRHGAPHEGLTIEDDLVDLGWHQREFARRSSFAYTMMTPDEGRCLGCVYIMPTRKRGHDCKVEMWVRADALASGLDEELYRTVRAWIAIVWPFTSPAFPGRAISFEEWHAMPIDRAATGFAEAALVLTRVFGKSDSR